MENICIDAIKLKPILGNDNFFLRELYNTNPHILKPKDQKAKIPLYNRVAFYFFDDDNDEDERDGLYLN